MKSLKLVLSTVALLAAFVTPVVRAADDAAPAKEHRKQHNPAEARVNRIDQAVGGLTTDQKAKLKDVFATNAEKLRTASSAERKTIMQGERESIRGILTPDQQTKFEAMQADAAGKAKAKGKKKKGQDAQQ